MPSFEVPDPHASVKLEISGLAACCFNADFRDPNHPDRVGRWEVALPRFDDHELSIDIRGSGRISVPRTVEKIEIEDRTGVGVENPKHEIGAFNRLQKEGNNQNDYRWLNDFTDGAAIGHAMPRMAKTNKVTMLYVYDATFYTDIGEATDEMLLAPHGDTGLIIDNEVLPTPAYHAGPFLDNTPLLGFVASNMLVDIHAPSGGQGLVDVSFNGELPLMSIPHVGPPRKVFIDNMENLQAGLRPVPEGSIILTPTFRYGRGDFFRYYEIFTVPDGSPKLHLWGKRKRSKPSDSKDSIRTGLDCGGVRLDSFNNLDGLLH